MVRTHVLPCDLPRDRADACNRASGQIYTGVLVAHWRIVRRKGLWLSLGSGKRWSDLRTDAPLHAHTIDAAQEGFSKACATTRALRKAAFPEARFPYHRKEYRTTIWKNTAIRRKGDVLELSNGRGQKPIRITIPESLRGVLRFLEVRLVYDRLARRYTWHIVVENGKKPKPAPGNNVVSVDLGEIHPAVVGDAHEATIVTCRERRQHSQGHAKRLASLQRALSRKTKGSRRYQQLVRTKVRMKAKHQRQMRDLEHKISKAVVAVAIEHQAATIVVGDVRDVADGVDCGAVQNGRMSRWDHGKVRQYIKYKGEAEGIAVELEDEAYTTQTCPNCRGRHKPRGRDFRCPSCGFQAHRDVVGQINILSVFKHGVPGMVPAPSVIRYRIPHNLRVMRRCRDTGQEPGTCPCAQPGNPVARATHAREAAGL